MPDPSDEPPPPSHPEPPAGSPAHLSPAPRTHPPSLRHPRETAAAPSALSLPPELNEALEWVRRHGNTDDVPDDPPAGLARTPRSRLPKEQRKFHKFDPEHPVPAPARSGQAGSSQDRGPFPPGAFAGGTPSAADHPHGITLEQIAAIGRLRQEARAPWLALGVGIFVFLLVAGAFLFRHAALSKIFAPEHASEIVPQKTAVAPEASADLPDGVLRLIDRAMAAEKAKDYPQAIQLLEQAQQAAGHVHGLNFRLASLCYQANDMARVLPLLDQSIADGEEVAACYNLRGTLANQVEGTGQGPGDLEKATRLDPFNARFLFGWGEALRRAGKPQLALVQLRRAVDRLEEPALLPVYGLKVRLAQIELDQDGAFAAELSTKLQLTPPPVDWLLTAAAVEMHRHNFPAAAEDLARVRLLIGPGETASLLQDGFFANFAREQELAGFFEAPTAAASPGGAIAP